MTRRKGTLLMLVAVAVVVLFTSFTTAHALTIAGYTFDDNAFADYLYDVSAGVSVYTFGTGWNNSPTFAEIETSVVGSDLTMIAQLNLQEVLTLGFSDNVIVNETGADFVIFELEVEESALVDVQLLGTAIQYSAVDTGYDISGSGYTTDINAIEVDLSDFGFASGAYVDLVTIEGLTDFDLAAVGALNSASAPVPEPSTMLLLGAGLVGLLGLGRKKFFKRS